MHPLVGDAIELLLVVALGATLWASVARIGRGEVEVPRCTECGRPTSRSYARCRHCGAA